MVEKMHVLLVEDTPIAARMAYILLEPFGCEIDHADDGAKAVELCAKKRYDLILMDVGLPTMDGFEATRRIRAYENGQSATPIIGVTAHTESSYKQEAVAAGMNACFTKPLTRDIVKTILKDYLSIEA